MEVLENISAIYLINKDHMRKNKNVLKAIRKTQPTQRRNEQYKKPTICIKISKHVKR